MVGAMLTQADAFLHEKAAHAVESLYSALCYQGCQAKEGSTPAKRETSIGLSVSVLLGKVYIASTHRLNHRIATGLRSYHWRCRNCMTLATVGGSP